MPLPKLPQRRRIAVNEKFAVDHSKDKAVMFFSASSYSDALCLLDNGIYDILTSYHYIMKNKKGFEEVILPRIKENGGLFMTDSGAFTFFAKPTDEMYEGKYWEEYIQEYCQFLTDNAHQIYCAANMDIDIFVGQQVVNDWNARYFEPLADIVQIVYIVHGNKAIRKDDEFGIKRFKEYAGKYQYLGLGSSMFKKKVRYDNRYYQLAKLWDVRIHGFGWTSIPSLKEFPFFSIDSSVVGDSSVVVRYKGMVERLSIEDLFYRFENYRTTSTELRADTLGYETLTVTDNKTVWKPLRSVVQHKVKKRLLKLKIEGGKDVTVTEDHSIIVMDKFGNLIEQSADNLKSGDFVLGNSKLPFEGKKVESVSVTIPKKKWSKVHGKFDVPIDTTMLEFLGLWLGDGSYCGEQGVNMSCYGDLENAKIIETIAYRFGAKVTVKSNGVDCSISNKVLYTFMRQLNFVGYSHTKKVPTFIHSLDVSGIQAFLRGYFSADGTGNSLGSSTVSKELKNDVEHLLIGMEIYPNISYRNGGTFVKDGKTYNKRESWAISIKDTESRKKFLELISFTQAYKQNALYLDIACMYGKYQIGSKKMGIPIVLSTTGRVNYGRESVDINKTKGKRVSRTINAEHFNTKVITSELLFLEIKSIEEVSNEEVLVYDLEVPETEKFFANGILVHNTTWLGGVRYGTTYKFDGSNAMVLDYKKKHLRKQMKALCNEIGINFENLLLDKRNEVNALNLYGWKGFREKFLKAANTKLKNKATINYAKYEDKRKKTPTKR